MTTLPLDTQLLDAASKNNLAGAIAAIHAGANLHATDENNTTAALWFASYNNLSAVLAMADICPTVLLSTNGDAHMTVAMYFALHNNVAALLALHGRNNNVLNYATPAGLTPAIMLALNNNVQALQILALINPTLLLRIADDGNSVATILAKHGNIQGLLTLQHQCPELRHSRAIEALLESGLSGEKLLPMVSDLILRGFYFPRTLNDLLEAKGIIC